MGIHIDTMVNNKAFTKIIEQDLDKLRFILKSKLVSFQDIKAEEEKIICSIKDLMASIKDIEHTLESEIQVYKRLKAGWEKAYAEKKWNAIGNALKEEIETFDKEYAKTKNLYENAQTLTRRFSLLIQHARKMNTSNVTSREQDLAILKDFKKQKEDTI